MGESSRMATTDPVIVLPALAQRHYTY